MAVVARPGSLYGPYLIEVTHARLGIWYKFLLPETITPQHIQLEPIIILCCANNE